MTQAPVLLPQFALTVRGYDRQQVDDYVARLVRDLDEAHARAVEAERALRQGGSAPVGSERGPADAASRVVEEAHREAAEVRASALRDAERIRARAGGAAPYGGVAAPAAVVAQDAPEGLRDGDGGSGPHRLPLSGLAGTSAPPARRRTAALAAAGVLALGAGAGVAAVVGQDDTPSRTPAADAPAAAAPAPDLAAAAAAVEQRGAQAGPAAGALRGALRRLQALQGLERQARGLSLASDVERAVAGGELTRATQALVRPSLLAETRVDDVPELVAVLAVRPAAAGPEGLALLRGLRQLRDQPTPQRAQALLAQVRSGPERGRLTAATRDVALPVLERAAR